MSASDGGDRDLPPASENVPAKEEEEEEEASSSSSSSSEDDGERRFVFDPDPVLLDLDFSSAGPANSQVGADTERNGLSLEAQSSEL